MTQIVVTLTMPTPEQHVPASPTPKLSPEEKVRDALDCIESGHDSHKEWLFLNKVYKTLRGKNSPRAKNLCKMIEPVLSKFGYHKTTAED